MQRPSLRAPRAWQEAVSAVDPFSDACRTPTYPVRGYALLLTALVAGCSGAPVTTETPPDPTATAQPTAPVASAPPIPTVVPSAAPTSTSSAAAPEPSVPWMEQSPLPEGLAIDGDLTEWKGQPTTGWVSVTPRGVTIAGKLAGSHDSVLVSLRLSEPVNGGALLFMDGGLHGADACMSMADSRTCEASAEAQQTELDSIVNETKRIYRIDAQGVTVAGEPLPTVRSGLKKGTSTTFEMAIPPSEFPWLSSVEVYRVRLSVGGAAPAFLDGAVRLKGPAVIFGGEGGVLARAVLPQLAETSQPPYAVAAVFDPRAERPTFHVLTLTKPAGARNPRQKATRTDLVPAPKVETTLGDLEILRYDFVGIPAIASRKAGKITSALALPGHGHPRFLPVVKRGTFIDVGYELVFTPAEAPGIQGVILGVARVEADGVLKEQLFYESAEFKGSSQRSFAPDLSTIRLSGPMLTQFGAGQDTKTWKYDPATKDYVEQPK